MNHEHESLYPIRAVSTMTGVNAATLRAWERRYRLIEPSRTAKGHRLYSPSDVARIHRIVELLDSGLPPSQIGALLNAEKERPGTGTPPGWKPLRHRLLSCVRQFDEPGLFRVYREALALHPLDDVTENLTVPVLEELGNRWEAGKGRIAEEHFFNQFVRNALGSRLFHRPWNPGPMTLVTACFPGELHDIGLLLFNLSAESRGYRIIGLGANTPLTDLPHVAGTTKAQAIVLSTTSTEVTDSAALGLRELVDSLEIPVLIGGKQSESDRRSIERAGATALGRRIGPALRDIHRLLEHARPR
jgi:DNA-binding transcriptional MerR regulator/methylmalonyl-CoA mutase cobalamin-binding subunit